MIRLAALAAAAILLPSPAGAAERRVDVVEVEGIIDAPTERAVAGAIRVAERNRSEVLVLQLDSTMAIGDGREQRLVEMVGRARVPVVAWVGPPGARAERAAATLVRVAPLSAMAPGAVLDGRLSAQAALDAGTIDVTALQIPDLLKKIDGRTVADRTLRTDPDDVSVWFHKLDMRGRVEHGVAKPSIAYLLLLLGLVGIVFELFHPSRGPAGLAGLFSLGLSIYGIAALGGSWLGFALVVAGVAGFSVDLRVQGLGLFTLAGLGCLVAGSILLFRAPDLRASPFMIAFGVAGMVAFLLGAMTRVLRDLRAIAAGELEVRDAHPGG